MGRKAKLDQEIRALPVEIRSSDLETWMDGNGWTLVRTTKGSHRIWKLGGEHSLSIPLTSKLTVKRRYIRQVIRITDSSK